MNVFLDTSALAKCYVAESGSAQVLSLCQQAERLVVSIICFPELISTLSRLQREKKLNHEQYTQLKQSIQNDLANVEICQLTPDVLTAVVPLLESSPLRAMDAIHVVCARIVGACVFVSADQRQLVAARDAGLSVIDVT